MSVVITVPAVTLSEAPKYPATAAFVKPPIVVPAVVPHLGCKLTPREKVDEMLEFTFPNSTIAPPVCVAEANTNALVATSMKNRPLPASSVNWKYLPVDHADAGMNINPVDGTPVSTLHVNVVPVDDAAMAVP
jgi:hypothetical protein